jgi:hypothetical protein
MDYETALNTCSKEVQAAIKWLEREVRSEYISQKLVLKNLCFAAEEFYVLSKVQSPLLTDFLNAAEKKEFWIVEDGEPKDCTNWSFDIDEPHRLLWYLGEIGLKQNVYFKKALDVCIKKRQTREGRIPIGLTTETNHPFALRILASVEPDSDATDIALGYFLNHLEEFKSHLCAVAFGVLALYELDYWKYKEIIENLCDFLKSGQEEDGYFRYNLVDETSIIVETLARILGTKNESVIKAAEWLRQNQDEDGSWLHIGKYTAYACLALMSVGEGPKIPIEEVKWKEMLTTQKLELSKPEFVQTSPTLALTEIKDKIREMLNNANERIWICSRFITEFWTDIITFKREKPHLDVRIVTHPITGQNKARYEGAGKKFVDPAFSALQRLLGKNLKTQPLLHARLYIVDNEVLVASADITSEQLEKEFNAGIWTRDKETVEAAASFFENLLNESGSETL